ncbi:MAG: hypothetical protein H0V17_04090 [Deltaproteobacteria bacterium]|nr:hypothetical protein [Deltaproteobacteria bacterium]
MKSDDEDFLNAAVPDPDAEPTAAERAHAKAFADLVDKTLVSGRMPPAMSSDDRALLEVATVIRATSGALELSATKQRSLVEDALRQAVGGGASTSLSTVAPVIPIKRRWLPWTVASVSSAIAAAAIIMLLLRKPAPQAPLPTTAEAPLHWKSRPADPLIGRIINECDRVVGLDCARQATVKTSSRIDHIFTDRLEGYRDRRFARRGGQP